MTDDKKEMIELKMKDLNAFIEHFEKETNGKGSADVAIAVWNMANGYFREGRAQMADELGKDDYDWNDED